MLFYDEEEADRMFREANFETIEHEVLQAHPGSPRAIVTLARTPK
jgi:demethylmenaquinone methyltransferase/2-methoxy-6-polyprenyl-1,4-benzoquinol methylase